ncbi:MAG: radical SAM protein [Acidobacteria bacterium]|nr:radical SAM protein [Acidobacteriota bacterium]
MAEVAAHRPGRLMAQARQWVHSLTQSEFRKNTLWVAALGGFERVGAMAQAVLISRALGITEYGVYGLLFGAVGFVASTAGFQMGLTATVFVSRYRESEKQKVAGVISLVGRFAWVISVMLVAAALPFSRTLAEALVGSTGYQAAVIVMILFVAATIVSGVQDGVAQGFEKFAELSKIKIGVTLAVLLGIYPAARTFGLDGVLIAILAGVVLKGLILHRVIRRSRLDAGIPHHGAPASFRQLIGDFALPSTVLNLVLGGVTWGGLFMLSRQQSGFDEVAIVSTGLQWRGPMLLLAASIGGVAVPAFGRLSVAGDAAGTRRLRRKLAVTNALTASAGALAMVVASGLIMAMYGEAFARGRMAFCLIALSTIPTVVANVYVHELVGSARMWRQLWLHVPYLAALLISFTVLVPGYHAAGYASALLIGSVVFLLQFVVADSAGVRRLAAAARRQLGWRLIISWNQLMGRSFVPVPWKQLFVEPTSRCNLACRFCAYPLEVRPRTELTGDTFQALLDAADRVGIERLWLTPMTGDVFMDKGIFRKLEAVQQSSVRQVAFYTNFVTPDLEAIMRLKTFTKLRELHISLYGATEERFAAITAKPPQQFRRLVRNLGWLADALHEWPAAPAIIIDVREGSSFDPTRWTGPLYDVVQRLVRDHRASVGTATEYDNWGGLITDDHVVGLDIALTPGESLYHQGACIHMFQSTMVTSTGEVVGCGCRGYDSGLFLGDTKTEPLEDILSSGNPRWRALIDGMNRGAFPNVCQSCGMYRSIRDHRWTRGGDPSRVTTLDEATRS